MSEVKQLLDELTRIHDGDAGHGPALREALENISAAQAAYKPIPDAHSIWELVLHIAAWENVTVRRLEGHPTAEPEEGDFPPVPDTSDAAWQNAIARLNDIQARFLNEVSRLTDAGLNEKVVGDEYSIRQLLRSTARHKIYHTAQISLLRKGWSAAA
ncbi:MAG: DinB family protein [Acidobacteria bacterium]|nr:DinB family protein [Acidobacteriota bacterium]